MCTVKRGEDEDEEESVNAMGGDMSPFVGVAIQGIERVNHITPDD